MQHALSRYDHSEPEARDRGALIQACSYPDGKAVSATLDLADCKIIGETAVQARDQ